MLVWTRHVSRMCTGKQSCLLIGLLDLLRNLLCILNAGSDQVDDAADINSFQRFLLQIKQSAVYTVCSAVNANERLNSGADCMLDMTGHTVKVHATSFSDQIAYQTAQQWYIHMHLQGQNMYMHVIQEHYLSACHTGALLTCMPTQAVSECMSYSSITYVHVIQVQHVHACFPVATFIEHGRNWHLSTPCSFSSGTSAMRPRNPLILRSRIRIFFPRTYGTHQDAAAMQKDKQHVVSQLD